MSNLHVELIDLRALETVIRAKDAMWIVGAFVDIDSVLDRRTVSVIQRREP